MDRNGKKAKAPRAAGEQHAERSDMKGNRRDVPAATEVAGKGKASDAGPSPRPGGKGGRR